MSSHLKKLFTPFSFPWISSSGLAFGRIQPWRKRFLGQEIQYADKFLQKFGIMAHLIVNYKFRPSYPHTYPIFWASAHY